MNDKKQESLFVIESLALLLDHLVNNEGAEWGDRQIIYSLIAREVRAHAIVALSN